MTEAIPFPATSLCLIVFLHILGVASFDKLVTLGFGNNVLLFLMGAMGLSAAMTSSGLARRSCCGCSPRWGAAPTHRAGLHSHRDHDLHVGHGHGRCRHAPPAGVSILESSGCKPLQSNFGRAS